MSTQSCNPNTAMRNKADAVLACCLIALTAASSCAFALSTDRDQPMDVKSNYLRTDQNKNTNPDVSVTYLKGDVQITQGSIKANGDEATIYQDNSDKNATKTTNDANATKAANAANAATPNQKSSRIKRVLMVGKQAHMEQVHDGDCGLMKADANTIDYHADTDIADMTGHVVVIQAGKGEFHGEHMIYNTNTGEMESGDNSPSSRVTMRFEPKNQEQPPPSTNNCGFPVGTSTAAKTAKPAAKHDDKH
jgi:lipopolysaccharide export system protein LptA